FVGRTHALAVLNRAYGHASEGNGKFVMVTGEPGIGKSRTLHEFLVPLQDRVCILWGHCAPAGGLPYQALVEAIRALGADHQPHVDLPILAEVARLMPEFHTMFRNVPLPEVADSAHSRMRLYDALVLFVASYSKADTPAVLVQDAHQCADSGLLN